MSDSETLSGSMGGGCIFEAGCLLTFFYSVVFRMGASSRWVLGEGWVLI